MKKILCIQRIAKAMVVVYACALPLALWFGISGWRLRFIVVHTHVPLPIPIVVPE